jgi:hypothetical protein
MDQKIMGFMRSTGSAYSGGQGGKRLPERFTCIARTTHS